ncbi:transcription factor LUX-like [Cucurbita maxima]|uniref:Transcription factor LUX-like n=1 Tax=Cucurbita maxima TaxID=3661 RepID=A0A6J1JRQ2_CUCMA|nr:transcription factor LUX-like [Cucurbita maxima]
MGSNPNQEEQAQFGGDQNASDNMYRYIQSLLIASNPGSNLINATSASINSGGTSSGFNDSGVGRASSSNPEASMNKRNGSHQKRRFIWTPEHHQSFLEVIEFLETQNASSNRKVVPRKILHEMQKKYPNITRENVASHLQKHRMHLKNLNNRELNNSATSLNSQLLQSSSSVVNPNFQVPQLTCSSSENPNFNVPPQTHSRSKNPNPQPPLRVHSSSKSPNSCPSPQNHFSFINPKYHHRSHLNPNNHPRSHLNPNYHSENANCHPLQQTHLNSINPNCDPLPQTHLISNDPHYQSIPQTHFSSINPNSNPNSNSNPHLVQPTNTEFGIIPCPPPISPNQTSSIDPIRDNPLEALNNPNFFQDYNMNFNSDNLQVGGAVANNMSLPLDSCCPFNLNPHFQVG